VKASIKKYIDEEIMKKINLLLALFLFVSYYALGQLLPGIQNVRSRSDIPRSRESVSIKVDQPLIFIGTLETNYSSLILAEDHLKILEVYTDSTQLGHFGKKGKNGVIIAALKTPTPLLRLEEVLDYFKVAASERHLKVAIDKKFIDTNLFLADINQIQGIELLQVTQQDILLSPMYHNDWVLGDKYLNIVTKD